MDPGSAPFNKALKADPLPCAVWKRMKSSVKAALSDTLASIVKPGLECMASDKFITVFFLMTYSSVPTILSGIFFLVFYFLKEVYSTSKTLVLNKMIIFYNPSSFFGHDIFDF